MEYEELESRSLLKVNESEDDGEITIEQAIQRTGNEGLGIYQITTLIICSIALSTQTLLFQFFALFTHKPQLFCETIDGNWESCSSEDYCENTNGTYTNYEIDWSKDSNDGTVRNWITEYELICGYDTYVSLVVSLYFGGTIAGAFFVNVCAEIWGRKPILVISLIFQIASLMVMVFFKNLIALGVVQFILGINLAAQSQVSTVYLIEITSLQHKALFNNFLQLFTHLWFLPIILICYLTRDIIVCVQMTIAISIFILICLTTFTCESPRYLFAHGNLDKTIDCLEYMTKINRTELKPINLHVEAMRDGILVSSISISEEIIPPSSTRKYNPIKELFATRKSFTVTMVQFGLWGSINFAYYGVAVNADHLRGSVYTVLLIIGVSTTIGTLIVLAFGESINRRTLYGGGCGIFVLCFLVYFFVGEHSQMVNEAALLIGITAITVSFSIIYLITAEIFPTYIRSTAFGLVNVVGKSCVFTVPYWNALVGDWTVVMYIVAGMISTVLTFFFEETRGLPLREDWVIPDDVVRVEIVP